MLRISMSMLENKQGITNKYVFNTLKNVFEYIKSEKRDEKTSNKTKYLHRGVECIQEIIDVFGLECAYIYCVIQVYKHMYLHEYDRNDNTEYSISEFYKQIANDIEKKMKGF